MEKPIEIYAISGQVGGTSAVSTLAVASSPHIKWQIVTDPADVPEDAVLFWDCPKDMEANFSWLNNNLSVDSVKILSSGILPEGIKTPSLILVRNKNKRGQWINLKGEVLSVIRMYLRYRQDNDKNRLPWGAIQPGCESTQAWLTWFWSISHDWDMTPVEEYKELRRAKKQPRGVRISVSEFVPNSFLNEIL